MINVKFIFQAYNKPFSIFHFPPSSFHPCGFSLSSKSKKSAEAGITENSVRRNTNAIRVFVESTFIFIDCLTSNSFHIKKDINPTFHWRCSTLIQVHPLRCRVFRIVLCPFSTLLTAPLLQETDRDGLPQYRVLSPHQR